VSALAHLFPGELVLSLERSIHKKETVSIKHKIPELLKFQDLYNYIGYGFPGGDHIL